MPESVSCRTSSAWAMNCNQVPTWLMACPTKKMRKLRTRSERNVSLVATFSLVMPRVRP